MRGWASADDAHAEAYLVADNELTIRGGWDERGLAEMLEEALDVGGSDLLRLTGFTDGDLEDLLASINEDGGDPGGSPGGGSGDDWGDAEDDLDDAPAAPREPRTQRGDVWRMGEHRLACADATDRAAWVDLFADCPSAGLLWTDPPADDVDAFVRFLPVVAAHLSLGAGFYVCHPADPGALEVGEALLADPWRFRQALICVSDDAEAPVGPGGYRQRHYPIFYGYLTNASGRRGRGGTGAGWYGDHSQDTVFEFPRPRAVRAHPTARSVDLVRLHLTLSLPAGQVVADGFTGSGTTLLAALAEGRVFRGTEIDPGMVDVACARYQALTGEQPVLERTGEPHDFEDLADLVGTGERFEVAV